MSSQKLNELIEKTHEKYPSEYKGFLSNHLTQGLIALYRIGASEEDLQNFYDHYIIRLKDDLVIPSQALVNEKNFHEYLGKRTNYLDLYDFFNSEIINKGKDTVLNKYCEILAPGNVSLIVLILLLKFIIFYKGICGAAFHGIIRLGYGLDMENEQLIAEGLAYCTFTFYKAFELGGNQISADQFTLRYILDSLKTIESSSLLHKIYEIPSFRDSIFIKKLSIISPSIQKFSHRKDLLPFFVSFRERIGAQEASNVIHQIILSSIALFNESGAKDFFLLHIVSAARAVQFLLPYIHSDMDRSRILSYLWVGMLLTYVNQGMPSVSKSLQSLNDSISFCFVSLDYESRWSQVIQMARKSKEEHIIKMVYVLKDEEQKYFSSLRLQDNKKCADSETLFLHSIFIETAEKMIENSGIHGSNFVFDGSGPFSTGENGDSIEVTEFYRDLQSHL